MGIHPNVLSLFAIIFSLVFFIALMNHAYILACFALLGTAFDMVDGTVARLRGKESAFGEILDSTLDRLSDSIIISAFGFAGIIQWPIIVFLIVFSLLTSFVRHRSEQAIILNKKDTETYKVTVGIIERPERIIIVFLAIAFYGFFPQQLIWGLTIPEIIFLFLSVLAFITVLQRLQAAYNRLMK